VSLNDVPFGAEPRPAPTEPGGTVAAMGTVYAIANQKGGVGKTTTAVNVAACIAEAGYPTLLVDVDPQANATVGLGAPKDGTPSIYDVLVGDASASDALRDTPVERLTLLPAHPDLAGATVELPRTPGSETRLRDALAPVRDRFAYTLLDCPPSLGPLTVNALVAADRVIVPVQTEYFALEGLAGLLDTLGLVQRELNPRLTVAGMLLTMHDGRTRLGRDVEREVREHFPSLVFETVIPRNVRVGEAPSFGRPVIHHDPQCAGSDAYFELAKEVAARG
jgi:chromosome partitioning protein